jgi:hypothetical protein
LSDADVIDAGLVDADLVDQAQQAETDPSNLIRLIPA